MKKIIIANWKMNPTTERQAINLAKASDYKNVVITPPFPFLGAISKTLKRAELGSQDVFWAEKGAFTGEVSAQQLKNIGVQYVIIGHSERRRYFHETDEMINQKVRAALKANLKVILCVGENKFVRKKGISAAKRFIKNQLQKDLKDLTHNSLPRRQAGKLITQNLIIAYEPIWAVGTGKSDQPEDVVEMARFIKKVLDSRFKIHDSRVLYGGSVNSKDVESFIKHREIDGALVGRASLRVGEFKKIIKVMSFEN